MKKPISSAELLLFGLIGACAPTNPRPAISTNMDPALPALSYSWKTNYAAVMAPPVAVQQKQMPPATSVSLIALL